MEYFSLMHVLRICMNIFILANNFVCCSNNLHFYIFSDFSNFLLVGILIFVSPK
jgi:hypothetical protein